MIALSQRQEMIADIEQAQRDGATQAAACVELGVSVRTLERWKQGGEIRPDGRPDAERPEPAHKLSEQERQRMLAICHEARFADLGACQGSCRINRLSNCDAAAAFSAVVLHG